MSSSNWEKDICRKIVCDENLCQICFHSAFFLVCMAVFLSYGVIEPLLKYFEERKQNTKNYKIRMEQSQRCAH